MPKFQDTLEINFNSMQHAKWEVLDHVPTIAELIVGLTRSEVIRRDAWIFMVRSREKLHPYYFDAVTLKILPFDSSSATSILGGRFSQNIGDGVNKEFIVNHDLNTLNVDAAAWEENSDRRNKVDCDIFLIKSNPNLIGFSFAQIPATNSIWVVVY
jgi:hypothetical protein